MKPALTLGSGFVILKMSLIDKYTNYLQGLSAMNIERFTILFYLYYRNPGVAVERSL